MNKIFGLIRIRNEEQILQDALNHLSSFCNGGIIVYDDCSTDSSVQICKSNSSVIKIIQGQVWDSNRERAEYENRAALISAVKEFADEKDWLVYIDADERIEFDWNLLINLSADVIAIRMKLFDFYITEEDKNLDYNHRKFIGPEYRKIIIAYRNLPQLEFSQSDQREVKLNHPGIILDEGYVKHYGKAISIENWERKCDYYSKHFPLYAEKWKQRKGKAVHQKFSDFGFSLIKWNEKETNGFLLYKPDLQTATTAKRIESIQKRALNVLLTNHHLFDFTGSEVYTLTLAKYLKYHGCNVKVYSPYTNEKMKSEFEEIEINVYNNLEELKSEYFDIAHVHHNITAYEVRKYFPNLKIVFLSHGVLPFLEQSPININDIEYLAISEEIQSKLLNDNKAIGSVKLFSNIVDDEEFFPVKPINENPESALVISGRIDEQKERIIREACSELDIKCDFIGGRAGTIPYKKMSELINNYDLVFSLGRGAIEAMLCGRIPIIFDYLGADGMVTPENFNEIKKNNFSGRRYKFNFDKDLLVNEIKKYKKENGEELMLLAKESYSAEKKVKWLVEKYHEILSKPEYLSNEFEKNQIEFIYNIINESRNYSYSFGYKDAESKHNKLNSELLLLSEHLIESGEIQTAKKIISVLLKYDSKNIDALNNLAVIQIMEKDYESALENIKTVIESDPANEVALGNLDYIQNEINENYSSENHTNTNLGDSISKRLNEAEEFISKNELNQAEKILRNIIDENPDNLDALNNLAVIDILNKNYSQALDKIQFILNKNPFDEIAISNLNYINELVSEGSTNKISETLEIIPCPFCNSSEAKRVRNSADIVQCSNCHTVYLRTRMKKEEMEKLYQSYADGDSHMKLPSTQEEIDSSPLRRDYFLKEILQYVEPKGNFLDIGCGWGAFLDNARKYGFTPRGIELTKKCVNFANQKLNIHVTSNQFNDTEFEKESFAVITMNHVFEHLPFPKESLKKIYQLLKPGGVFAGIVPNYGSYMSENMQDNWYWLDPNYHYVHYTVDTLEKHLINEGFTIKSLYTATGDFGKTNVTSKIQELEKVDEHSANDILELLNKSNKGEEIRFIVKKEF